MSRVVTSPVRHFSGSVTLQDPLYFPQVIAVRDARLASEALGEKPLAIEYNHAILPGVIACVEEWHLRNVLANPTADTFPTTPAESANKLVDWLVEEVNKLFLETEEIPNA